MHIEASIYTLLLLVWTLLPVQSASTTTVLRVNVTTTTVTATSTTTAATVTSTPTTTTTPAPTFEEFCYIAQTNFSAAKTLQQVVRPITHFPKRHPLTLANWCGGSSRDDNRISNSEPYCPQCFQCGYTKWGTGKPPLSAYVGKGPKVALNQNSCRVRPESRPGFSQSDRSNCVAGGCDACTCAAPCKATTRTTGVCTPRDPDKCTMTLIKGTANRLCYVGEISDFDCERAIGGTGVRGWEAFYASNAPNDFCANTGYEEPEVALIYFVQNYDGKRDILKTYLVLTLSKSDNPDGGGCGVYVDSPSLGGKGVNVLLCDDGSDCAGGNSNWNSTQGRGTLGTFSWDTRAGDGLVMGAIPNDNHCLNLQFSNIRGLKRFKIGSYNSLTGDVDFVDYSATEAERGFSICGHTCANYCAQLASCGQCTADPLCAWCDNACVYRSKPKSQCKSRTDHGQNCPACSAAKSCGKCVANPSCGWCHSTASCSSVVVYNAGGCDKHVEMPLQLFDSSRDKCAFCPGALDSHGREVDADSKPVSAFCSGHGLCRTSTSAFNSDSSIFSNSRQTLTERCECADGYTGHACDTRCPHKNCTNAHTSTTECASGTKFSSKTGKCECDRCFVPDPETGGQCVAKSTVDCGPLGRAVCRHSAFVCQCPGGLTGEGCKACGCRNGGSCNPISHVCDCKDGTFGKYCEQTECTRKTCSDHGRCDPQTHLCTCDQGWEGTRCQTDSDDCLNAPCKHGACSLSNGWYACACEDGWEGQDCGTVYKPTTTTKAPARPFAAVINGPTRVSAKSCDEVTLDAYQSADAASTSDLRYLWTVPDDAAKVLTSDRRSPALTLKNLPPGDYEFGLSVTSSHTAGNARGFKWKVYKTARANAFRLTVFPEAAILLTLPCPAQVCSPTGPGTYDVKAWTHQKTVLTVTVKPRVCSDGGGERNQVTVAWTQLNLKENGRWSSAAESDWRPVTIGELKYNNRWLVIPKGSLPRCVRTVVRVAARDAATLPKHTWVTLLPQKADIVAVVQADVQRVGYEDAVALRAHRSYDPDRVGTAKDFEYVWSCVKSWPVGVKDKAQACQDADGAALASELGSSDTFKFTPKALKMSHDTVYEFVVVVRAGAGNSSDPFTACYDKVRSASATVTVEVGPKQQPTLQPLKVAVCSSFPCDCLKANIQKKFNANANVAFKACSGAKMVRHKWEPKSKAAAFYADISPRNILGQNAQPTVTVTLREPVRPSSTRDEPYTFTVTATFASGDGEDKIVNTASTTLQLNYPPRGGNGQLIVENKNKLSQSGRRVRGVPLKDLFKIAAPNWEDEDGPLTYSFHTIDTCTNGISFLENPIPTATAIITTLRPDLGRSCGGGDSRVLVVAGTVTDRLGASAELCNKDCDLVILSPMPDPDPNELFRQLETKLNETQITRVQAMDGYVFAVQALQKQIRKTGQNNTATSPRPTGEQVKQMLVALEAFEQAAISTLGEITPDTPAMQGRMLDNVASVLQSGLITDEVASTALSAATTMIGDMQAASSSGHVQEVVQAVANVFRGVARHSSSPSSEHARDMKLNLRNHAGNFCDKLTSNSAPDAAALGSASSDFLFSCQKVESAPTDGSGQVEVLLAGSTSLLTEDGKTFPTLPLRLQAVGVPEARPRMSFRAVHLQVEAAASSGGTSLSNASNAQTSKRRRLSTKLCAPLPLSELRLTTDESLEDNIALHVTHRVDIPLASCACRQCSARQTIGDLLLPTGKHSTMVLFQLNFAGGQVLQKYYKVATHAGDATLHKETVTTAPPVTLATRQRAIAKTKHTQILEIAIRERATSDLDNFIRVNPVVNPNTGSTAARVSPIYVVAILCIFGIVLCFVVCIVLAVLSESRPQERKRRRDQEAFMFMKDGYINPYTLPSSIGKNPSLGRLILFAFETYHIALSTFLTFVPFGCATCKKTRRMLHIMMPGEVRLSLLLIQILNYMWIDAMFLNHREAGDDCLLKLICLDSSWIFRRFSAIVIAFCLHVPAMRIIPRMFRYTLHLQSNTAHSSVPRGFRPTLTYLFEAKRLTSLRATLQTIRGLRVVVPKTVFSTPIQAFAPSSNAENPPGPDRSPPMSIRSNNFVQVTTRVVPLQSVSEPPPPRRLRTRHKTHPLPNPNGDKNAKQTKKLRAAELNAWENDPYIRKFRIFQLFLCWFAVFVFAAIPAGFCVVYAHTFSEHTLLKWIRTWLLDMVTSMVLMQALSVLSSFFIAWAYVKLRRLRSPKNSRSKRFV